jgi:hypothetical protein
MFKAFLGWLKRLGSVGAFLSNVLQFLFAAYPTFTWSVITTAFLARFTGVIHWVQQPNVYFTAAVFLFILWTFIGLLNLRDRQRTSTVRIAHDYAYSLINEGGWQAVLIRTPPNHVQHPNMDALSITLGIRNVGHGPLRMRVDEMRVVLNSRTSDGLETAPELIFARLAVRGVKSGPIERDPALTFYQGTAAVRLSYGAPGGPWLRRYTIRANLSVNVNFGSSVASVLDDIVEEKDEPYENG